MIKLTLIDSYSTLLQHVFEAFMRLNNSTKDGPDKDKKHHLSRRYLIQL
jgi:hypothetical protein